jgi:predicted CXXCH cytochrome family protein
MRKVFLLAAALMLVATQAMAIAPIKNTKHNLSTSGPGAVLVSDNYDELCVFCHTPHAADTSVTNAPLWNRGTVNTISEIYNSSTLETESKGAGVVTAINNSDAALCMSCHDGSSMAGGLVNPSNLAGGSQPTFAGASAITGDANLFDTAANSLRNDHPIGMVYNTVAIKVKSGQVEFKNQTATGLNFYGSGNTIMWCSSCHDVHDNTNAPFLATSNAGSGLCLACHIK